MLIGKPLPLLIPTTESASILLEVKVLFLLWAYSHSIDKDAHNKLTGTSSKQDTRNISSRGIGQDRWARNFQVRTWRAWVKRPNRRRTHGWSRLFPAVTLTLEPPSSQASQHSPRAPLGRPQCRHRIGWIHRTKKALASCNTPISKHEPRYLCHRES